jgi:putative transposase
VPLREHQQRREDNHPIELYNAEILQQKMDYIHNNPVAAGFVDDPAYYLYSSARDFCEKKGMLDITFMN